MSRFLFLGLIWPNFVFGQVSNDRIVNRILLVTDTLPTITSTAGSTIEWDCVNKSLTNKCLVYHNDQWFTFMVAKAGKYFLNVIDQECRDKLGIQVILLEGDPCKTSTYCLIKCIPKTKLDDFYIELDSLRSGVPYLLNIDGFLGDHCNFAIQLATKPSGIPLFTQGIGTLKARSNVERNKATVTWEIDPVKDDDLEEFRVYRTEGDASVALYTIIPVERNSIGVIQTTYSFEDSLQYGTKYVYRILGLNTENDAKYWNEIVVHPSLQQSSYRPSIVYLYPEFRTGDRVQIIIFDNYEREVIDKSEIVYDRKENWALSVDIGKYISQGRVSIRIVAKNKRTGQTMESTYTMNKKGEWIKN